MAFGKLVNLFALSSLAVIVCTYGVAPVNGLAVDGVDALRYRRAHSHDVIAKKRRSPPKHKKRQDGSSATCRTRSSTATSSPTSTWSDTESEATTTTAATDSTSSSWSDTSSPSSTTSSSAAATSTSTSSSSGSGKLGLAWANGDDSSLSDYVNSNTKYIYTWDESCPSQASSLGLTCMPMLWSNAADKEFAFQSTVVQGYASIAMGFNEVNEAGQANMDVADAVTAWNTYLEPLASQGYQLLAPVTSSNPNGYTWVQEFIEQCTGCSISGIPVHYYGTSAQDMITYIQKWEGFGKPIWVTEFACENYNTANENDGQQCSEDQVWDFYKTIVDYMESDSNVVAYFPFGVMRDMQGVNTLDQLMDPSTSSPTTLMNAIMNLSF